MKIALVSDTHDNAVAIDRVIEALEQRGIETVLHCGDMVAPYSLLRFKEGWADGGSRGEDGKWSRKFYFVFGNNDGATGSLMKIADGSDGRVECLVSVGELNLEGKTIFMTHDSLISDLVARSGKYDFCFGGHDHKQRKVVYTGTDESGREWQSIFVNPGNLAVKREGEWQKSFDNCFCIVDLETAEVERVEI